MCNVEKRELNRLAERGLKNPACPAESCYLSWSYCMSINTDMLLPVQRGWTAALTFTTQEKHTTYIGTSAHVDMTM